MTAVVLVFQLPSSRHSISLYSNFWRRIRPAHYCGRPKTCDLRLARWSAPIGRRPRFPRAAGSTCQPRSHYASRAQTSCRVSVSQLGAVGFDNPSNSRPCPTSASTSRVNRIKRPCLWSMALALGGTVDAQPDQGDLDILSLRFGGQCLRARECRHWKYAHRHWTADQSSRPRSPK